MVTSLQVTCWHGPVDKQHACAISNSAGSPAQADAAACAQAGGAEAACDGGGPQQRALPLAHAGRRAASPRRVARPALGLSRGGNAALVDAPTAHGPRPASASAPSAAALELLGPGRAAPGAAPASGEALPGGGRGGQAPACGHASALQACIARPSSAPAGAPGVQAGAASGQPGRGSGTGSPALNSPRPCEQGLPELPEGGSADAAAAAVAAAAASGAPAQICFDFTKGACARGPACKYSHDVALIAAVNSAERGICFDFLRGSCGRGVMCRFSHSMANIRAQQALAAQTLAQARPRPAPRAPRSTPRATLRARASRARLP
jgi:hypothetical protein